MLKHRIGNGCGTLMWYDNWHPLGSLLDKFGQRVVYDATLSVNSRVSTVIEGDVWHWPLTNTLELNLSHVWDPFEIHNLECIALFHPK